MRGLLLALAIPVALVPALFAGCLSDDSASSSGGDAAVTYDGNLPVLPLTDGGSQDASTYDATSSDAGDGSVNVIDSSLVDSSLVDSSLLDAADAADSAPLVLDAGTANVRLVNLVPDLGTAIDVCAAVQGGALEGPFLELEGVTAGLAYGQMTEYVTVPLATHFQVRVVAANAADCSVPLVPDVTNLPITVAQRATVALMGSTSDAGSHPPALVPFPDDEPTAFPTEGARIRIVHAAALSPPTDFEIGAGPYAFKQHLAVPYGSATSPATMATGAFATDGNGYFTEPLFTAQVTATHTTDVTSFVASYLGHGLSAFYTGLVGSVTTPPAFVVCDDTATPTDYMLPCTTYDAAPTLTTFRIEHAAPDAPAVDMCFAIQGNLGAKYGPFLQNAGVPGGVSYAHITGELGPVPTDTSFNFYYVPAGQPCSQTPAAVVGNPYFFGQPGVTDQTAVLDEAYYDAGPPEYLSDTDYTSFAATPGEATISLIFLDFAMFNLPVDVSFAPPDGGAATDLSMFSGGTGSATLAPGTYSLRVTWSDDAGTRFSENGLTFGAGDRWILSLDDTSTTTVAATRCNLAQADASAVTACAQ